MATRIDWRIWFGHCATTDELKKHYKNLARQHHPDLGGDLRTMQDINAAFDAACREFVPREKPGKSQDYYDRRASVDEALREELKEYGEMLALLDQQYMHWRHFRRIRHRVPAEAVGVHHSGCPVDGHILVKRIAEADLDSAMHLAFHQHRVD